MVGTIVGMPSGAVAEIKSMDYYWWNREPEPGTEHFAGTVQILIGEAARTERTPST